MKIEITLTRSLITSKPNQRKTAHALGLKRVGQSVIKETNDAINGQVNTIKHLVSVKEV